jgi:hypothetical protein
MQLSALSILEHIAEEVVEEAAGMLAAEPAEPVDDAEQTASAVGDSAEEQSGDSVEAETEWEVAFEGYARMRSEKDTSANNTIGQKGPQGAIAIGELEDGWLKLLYEPGFIKLKVGEQVLLKKRKVSYTAVPDGTSCSGGLRDIPDRLACKAAAVALGSTEESASMKLGSCSMKGANGAAKICSTGVYPMWEENPEESQPNELHSTHGPPNKAHNMLTTTAPTTTTENEECKSCTCCPEARDQPTIVIPTFERDLCKLKVTARSITKHDKDKLLGKVIIAWVSHHPSAEYGDAGLNEVKELLYPHGEVEVIDMVLGDGIQGWVAQQAVKLKISSRVSSQYYLVLDSKNTFLEDVTPETFFTSCNQAKIFGRYHIVDGDMPVEHLDWYRASANVLGTTVMDQGVWPASITPILLHRQTVLDMLDRIGEPQELGFCSGGLCGAFQQSATEFTLYNVYVGRHSNMECIHAIEERPWGHELSASIWRANDAAGLQSTANQVKAIAEKAEDNGKVMFFGAQAGAFDGFEGDARFNVLQDLYKVLADAGLYYFDNWDEMAECVIGNFYNGRL